MEDLYRMPRISSQVTLLLSWQRRSLLRFLKGGGINEHNIICTYWCGNQGERGLLGFLWHLHGA